MGHLLYINLEFFTELWENFVFTLMTELTSLSSTYPSLRILFNKHYIGNMLLIQNKIYKMYFNKPKKFIGQPLYINQEFFKELWEDFIFTLVTGLTSSLITYPSLQLLFNKNYIGNMLLIQNEIYKIYANKTKKFHKLKKIIKYIKMYLCMKKYVFISCCAVIIFRIFDAHFFPVKEQKILVSFHPTMVFDLLKPLYFGLNKIIAYCTAGIIFRQNRINMLNNIKI